MPKLENIKELESFRQGIRELQSTRKKTVSICNGSGCRACGSNETIKAFKESIEKKGLNNTVRVIVSGCQGFCERGTLVHTRPEEITYQKVTPDDVDQIIDKTILNGEVIDKLIYTDPGSGKKYSNIKQIPFYEKQTRLLTGLYNHINPTSIDDYIETGGYSALAKVLKTMSPEEVIETIKLSGLRGRGGGGFPTGRKWESCHEADGDVKYIIINAEEGNPGAFMDKEVLEGNPHSVLEGLIIGAYAIGSSQGYIYVRMEYPRAVKYFRKTIQDAREYGFLGKNILGSGFDFDVQINQGGGVYICGESTALMASIEGKVGEPRAKHVHTAEKGLWNKPTTLNNVETLANVPLIIEKGWEWYSKIGAEKSKGTKIFSLVGKVKNTGLIEITMGLTLREIIFGIGGGIKGNKRFKGVQTGGPSGGVIPESLLDIPVDFDRLTEKGSMMGSGGMIVLDEDNCMVDMAKYFINFLKDESCGKCTSCREGLIQMSNILEKICNGKGIRKDLDKLEDLSWIMTEGSMCQLGKTAANPVITTLQYFKNEYLTHIDDQKCLSGTCKALYHYKIDKEKCTGCLECRDSCPENAISGENEKVHVIDQEKCTKCGICYEVCPGDFSAVGKQPGSYKIQAEKVF